MRRLINLAMPLVVGLVLLAETVAAIEVTATADPVRVTLGDYVTFTITVQVDGSSNVPRPTLPNMKDFRIVRGPMTSQNMQFVNGAVSASLSFAYTLQAKAAGSFTIEPATVTQNGQSFSSDPVTIEVLDPGRQPSPAPDQRGRPSNAQAATTNALSINESQITGDLHLFSVVSDDSPYVGEQIQYKWVLYLSQKARNAIRSGGVDASWPNFSGFQNIEIEGALQNQRVVNGRTYLVVEKSQALFPNSRGQVTLDPAECRIDYGPFSMFNRRRAPGPSEISGNPVTITVRDLPPDPPDGFDYVIGNFSIAASVNKTNVKVGEAVTLTLRITGEGNVRALPELDFAHLEKVGFKVFEPDVSVTVDRNRFPVAGVWEAKIILVPREEGSLVIPAVEIPVFNTRRERYENLASRQIVLQVAPGDTLPGDLVVSADDQGNASPVERLGRDINYLMTDFTPRTSGVGALLVETWPVRLGALLPPFMLLGVVLASRRRERFFGDDRFARRRFAHLNLRKKLEEARTAASSGDVNAFYSAVSRAILEYVADHTDRQALGLTPVEVETLLRDAGVASDDARAARRLLDDCEYYCYGGGSGDASEMEAFLQQAEELLRKLQEVLGA